MTETADNPEVFFERTYDFRTWRFYVAILVFVGFGTIALISLTSDEARNRSLGEFLAIVALLGGLSSIFVIYGLVVLLRVILGVKVTVRIDSNGITRGRRHWRWDQVKWIGREFADVKGRRPRYILSFVRTGGFFRRGLWGGQLFSEEEINAIMSKVGQFLTKNHPDVGFLRRGELWNQLRKGP